MTFTNHHTAMTSYCHAGTSNIGHDLMRRLTPEERYEMFSALDHSKKFVDSPEWTTERAASLLLQIFRLVDIGTGAALGSYITCGVIQPGQRKFTEAEACGKCLGCRLRQEILRPNESS